jgi:hypothetical protein
MTTRVARLLVLSAVLLAPALSPAARAGVLMVDGPAGSGYPNVQAAVDAATNGDVILVQPGGGGLFTIVGKSLTVIADRDADAPSTTELPFGNQMGSSTVNNVVQDIGPGGVVVLRGLLLGGLEITNVQGTVWVEDCEIKIVSPAMRATNCARLVVTHSTITGPNGFIDAGGYFWASVGGALELVGTNAAVSDSMLTGGTGKGFGFTQVGPSGNESGGDALRISGGSLALQGCTLTGGDGGAGGVVTGGFCISGGAGGAGLRVLGGAQVSRLASSATGGSGAPGPTSGCFMGGGDGPDGQPVEIVSGGVLDLPGGAVALRVASPVREGEDVELAIDGAAGAFATVLLSSTPGLQPVGKVVGPVQVGLPALLVSIGPIPAGEELVVHANLPNLPASLLSIELFLQAVLAGPAAPPQASAPSVLVGLDASL